MILAVIKIVSTTGDVKREKAEQKEARMQADMEELIRKYSQSEDKTQPISQNEETSDLPDTQSGETINIDSDTKNISGE